MDKPERGPVAVVAVAASAGGVEALTRLARSLPADFPGVVLVVLHIPESGPSVLPEILRRAGPLPAAQAEDGMPLTRGQVLVAPPGKHLRVKDGVVVLDRGPRENWHRPSADALLRTTARTWGRRAAGVVLSGTLDDGAAGLRAIGLAGGLTVVQDPKEAAFPGMPLAAITEADPDTVCPVDAIGPRLVAWIAGLPARADPPGIAVTSNQKTPSKQGASDVDELVAFTCPECGGNLFLDDGDGVERYRCRVGHAFSSRGLLVGKQDAIEAALWAAVVALEERADLSRRLLKRVQEAGRTGQVRRYRDDIDRARRHIDLLRGTIADLIDHAADTEDTETEDAERDGTDSTA